MSESLTHQIMFPCREEIFNVEILLVDRQASDQNSELLTGPVDA